jgi:pimeloyl-ACP methyl ester carboxylesterase
MLVLHGIYGAGRNWRSVARRFVDVRPEWGVLLVDLREHGASQGFPPPHDLEASAADLRRLVEAERVDAQAILGHSFGGKVALVYSREPAVPLRRVWVADSTPDERSPDGSAWRMLRVLRLHAGPFTDRAAAMAAVESEGFHSSVAQWMSTNLVKQPDGLVWRLDPDDMEALLRSFFSTDAWDAVERPADGTHVHVMRAEASSILTDEACLRIEAAGRDTGRVHLHRVQGGHWLNTDNPEELQRLLVTHMD